MKDFSLPPYDIGTIGQEVKRIGAILGVECILCAVPSLKEQGYFSLPTLSEDIVRIATKYGIPMSVTGDLEQTGRQLQSLINALRSLGVLTDSLADGN